MDISNFDFREYTVTPMTKYIHKMFTLSFRKEWYETYWAIDLHGTIISPNYKKGDTETVYYYKAKEVLQLLTNRDDIKLILSTCSFPEEITHYLNIMEKDGIHFDNVNENPDISSRNGNFGHYDKKYYFNLMLDDKAGFEPELEWGNMYRLLKKYEELGLLPDKNWTTKF